MAITQIRNEQLKDLTIELGKIREGAELIKRDGSVAFTGNVNANTHLISNVVDPVNAQDAATKHYVDVIKTAADAADAALQATVSTINGDATTAGSFRKAIADVIGGAPAALDTLKEIADYIAVNPNANVATAINAAISTVQSALATEVAARQADTAAAATALTSAINTEVTARQAGDAANAAALATEVTARQTDTATLTSTIAALDTAYKAADTLAAANAATALTNAVAAESTARQTADAKLTTDLAAEVAARQAADTALQTTIVNNIQPLIAAETAARQAADTALQTTITTNIQPLLDAEVAARQAADAALQTTLNVVNGDATTAGSFRKAIADVIGNAPAALDTLKEIADYITVNPSANVAAAINAAITTVQTSLAAEVTARQADTATLTSALAAEATARQAVFSGLSSTTPDALTITKSGANASFAINDGLVSLANVSASNVGFAYITTANTWGTLALVSQSPLLSIIDGEGSKDFHLNLPTGKFIVGGFGGAAEIYTHAVNEVATTVDQVTYTLAHSDYLAGEPQVFSNGLLQRKGANYDYTVVNGAIVFNSANETTDVIMVTYYHNA